ncbi:hypothetical protein FRC12_023930, partial [Ceratobasidium sp. 428]
MTTNQHPNLVADLSPLGDLLASSNANGNVLLTNVNSDVTLGIIEFGPDCRVTDITWATNVHLIVANEAGELIQADIMRSAPSDSKLATLSLITRSVKPVKALCFDVFHYLLAAAFDDEIQIWRGHLVRGYRREWSLYDTVRIGRDRPAGWLVPAMTFFSNENKSLFVATNTRFAIWMYSDKSFWLYDRTDSLKIKCCAVSPDSRTLAVSTEDLRILVWPISVAGPVLKRQQSFKIPTPNGQGRNSKTAPIAFLTSKLILTANSAGSVYVLSLDGQTQSVLSIGDEYQVKSIQVHYPLAQIIALGPRNNPIIIGCTNQQGIRYNSLAITELEQLLIPRPRSRVQDATTELRITSWTADVVDAWVQAHSNRMHWMKIVIAIIELWLRDELLDLSFATSLATAWKVTM